MNIFCWWYQERLLAYTAQALPEHHARRVESHLTHCASCRAELAASRRFSETMRAATPASAAPNPYLWERLEAAILAEAAPKTRPVRRLAPLAAIACSGVALAAVGVQYRAQHASKPMPLRQVASLASPAADLASPEPVPIKTVPVAQLSRPAAVQAGRQVEKISPPAVTVDPFVVREKPRAVASLSLPRVARRRSGRRLLRKETVALAPDQAVALVEMGTRRVVEEVHTEKLNRMVVESEQGENQEKTRRAACAPTEATMIAQQTRSLFQ